MKKVFKKIYKYFFENKCDCGKMKVCPRKINVDSKGNVSVENHFECKSIQVTNQKLDDWYNNTLGKK